MNRREPWSVAHQRRANIISVSEGWRHCAQLTVALLGLAGFFPTALIAGTGPGAAAPPATSRLTLAEARREAEQMTARWVEAWQSGDVETLVALSVPPFFLDDEIHVSSSDLRARYRAGAQAGTDQRLAIDRVMSGSVGEYRRLGYVTKNDRLLSRMRLTDDDLVVILIVSTESLHEEGIGFYFRRLANRVEMAGFWD